MAKPNKKKSIRLNVKTLVASVSKVIKKK